MSRIFYNQNTGEYQTEAELMDIFNTGCTGFETFGEFVEAALSAGQKGVGIEEMEA